MEIPDDEPQNSEQLLLPTVAIMGKSHADKSDNSKEDKSARKFAKYAVSVAQACVLLYSLLISYLCFTGDFVFFTWHPLLLSVGWMLLMSEAILVLSKDNVLVEKLSKLTRLRLHWILQLVGTTLALAGFIIVYINKGNVHKTHFTSWHGLFGLIGVIFSAVTCINGAAALYNIDLRQYVSPKVNKFVHILSGVVTYTFGGAALILSVYTKWFERNTSSSGIIFILGLFMVVTAVAVTLYKPVTGCWKRLVKLM